MSDPRACDRCLRRAWMVGGLAPCIELALAGHPGGRVRELLALPDDELAAAVGGRAEAVRVGVAEMRAALRSAPCWACCRHDGRYPEALGDLGDAPAVLFGRGDADLLAVFREPVATVVGSRRPSAYGRTIADDLASGLARAGIPVVSGMAIGIDACAHEGALGAGGRTVAVLGGGPEAASPSRNQRLYDRILARGLVLSELPPGTTPRRWSFPARNRIMAALGAMTVVVEARARSGSLITAEMASDLGRDVGAVPGLVGSSSAAGTNWLLRDGAHVIRSAEDVIDSLGGVAAPAAAADPVAAMPPELAAVLDAVDLGASSADAVARQSGVPPDRVAGALVRLELQGLVASDSMGRYRPRGRRS